MGEWVVAPLKEYVKDFIVPMRDKPIDLSGSIPWCRIEDFDGKYLTGSKSNQGVTLRTVKQMNLKVFPIGTLLVSCSAYLGRCAITERELVTNQTFIGLVPKEKTDVEYLFYAMQREEKKLNSLSSGTTISYLSREQFEKYKLQFPVSTAEQSKIAEVLSSVDETIDKTCALIEKYKNVKAGMMQDLLGSGDEVLLGDTRYFDINPRTSSLPRRFYYIDLESVISGELMKQDIFERTNAPSRAQRLIKPNDILFQMVRPYQQNNYFFEQEFDLPSVASTGYAQIRTSQNPKFIYYALHTGKVLRNVIAKCTGSSYPAINSTELKKVSIVIPSIAEQNRVAEQLSAVDQKIKAERNYLAKLQDIKLGLMQDLLTNTVSVDVLL